MGVGLERWTGFLQKTLKILSHFHWHNQGKMLFTSHTQFGSKKECIAEWNTCSIVTYLACLDNLQHVIMWNFEFVRVDDFHSWKFIGRLPFAPRYLSLNHVPIEGVLSSVATFIGDCPWEPAPSSGWGDKRRSHWHRVQKVRSSHTCFHMHKLATSVAHLGLQCPSSNQEQQTRSQFFLPGLASASTWIPCTFDFPPWHQVAVAGSALFHSCQSNHHMNHSTKCKINQQQSRVSFKSENTQQDVHQRKHHMTERVSVHCMHQPIAIHTWETPCVGPKRNHTGTVRR